MPSSLKSPGTVADDASFGFLAWSSPSSAAASDDAYSNTTPGSDGAFTHYLKATNFAFAIPTGVTIDGITVEVERSEFAGISDHIRDARVRIVKGGIIGSTDKADAGTDWPTADAYQTYGGASDLWGEAWAAEDINAADFGVVIAATFADPGGDEAVRPRVDHIRITVHYTEAATARTQTLLGVGR
jgi:hypothetical protein